MTYTQISKALKVSRPTILRLRKDFPDTAPDLSSTLDDWRRFVDANLVMDEDTRRDKARPIPGSKRYASKAELIKQRVIKLRLENQAARERLAILKRETVTVQEVKDTMVGIKATVTRVMLEMSAEVAPQIAGKSPAECERLVASAMRESLERLSTPDAYFPSPV